MRYEEIMLWLQSNATAWESIYGSKVKQSY
jgi:hypothetical protein